MEIDFKQRFDYEIIEIFKYLQAKSLCTENIFAQKYVRILNNDGVF